MASCAESELPPCIPWRVHSRAALLCQSEVRESPVAGLGRFFLEDRPQGSLVMDRLIVSTRDFLSKGGVIAFDPAAGIIIRVDGAEDLDALVNHFSTAVPDAGDAETVAREMSDFVGGMLADDTDDGKPFNFVLMPSMHVNHSSSPNTKHQKQGDRFVVFATVDIKANDEMFTNYERFHVSEEVDQWLKARSLSDPTATVGACQAAAGG
mmetsp:Transcript_48816/g.116056  ORF Transcript_48816/g.116056 Transcript_48816/m.116056 type:complete len:209 (-) Transcript_48816:74-700(-)